MATSTTEMEIKLLTDQINKLTQLEALMLTGKTMSQLMTGASGKTLQLLVDAGIGNANSSLVDATLTDVLAITTQAKRDAFDQLSIMAGQQLSTVLRDTVLNTAYTAAQNDAQLAQGYAKSAEAAYEAAREAVRLGEPSAGQRLIDAATTVTQANTAADNANKALETATKAFNKKDSAGLDAALTQIEQARTDAQTASNLTWDLADPPIITDPGSGEGGAGGGAGNSMN